MADTHVEQVYVYGGEVTGWVPVVRDECNLPIESTDGTVVVDGASSVFTVSTGGTKRVAVASGGQLLVGNTTVENANFNVHVRGDDNVQICVDATDVAATTGAVLKLRTGDKKYWNIQHVKNVDGSPEENQLVIANGVGTFLRGYQDNTAVFTGRIQTPSIKGLFANDAEITLGSQATLKAGDGSEYVPTNSASIATKKTVDDAFSGSIQGLATETFVMDADAETLKSANEYADDKIWVGTTAAYNALATKNPKTLYCLTD